MTAVREVVLHLVVEQHAVERSVEVGFLLPVMRNDFERAVRLLFERYAPFGSHTQAALQFGIHLDKAVGFMAVGHGPQVRFEVFHANTFLDQIVEVDFRGVQRLESLLLHQRGGIDTVVLQNLRVEVDADKLFERTLSHDENARVRGILCLLHELLEESFECRILRVHVEQVRHVLLRRFDRVEITHRIHSRDGSDASVTGLLNEHDLLGIVRLFFVHNYDDFKLHQ